MSCNKHLPTANFFVEATRINNEYLISEKNAQNSLHNVHKLITYKICSIKH